MRAASWFSLVVVGGGPVLYLIWLTLNDKVEGLTGPTLVTTGIAGIVAFMVSQVYMMVTEFALTDQRIILKRGFISRWTNEIPLHSLENVNLEQTIFSRIFGFGQLEVNGSGGSGVMTPPIQDPVAFRSAIAEARIAIDNRPHFKAYAPPIEHRHNDDLL